MPQAGGAREPQLARGCRVLLWEQPLLAGRVAGRWNVCPFESGAEGWKVAGDTGIDSARVLLSVAASCQACLVGLWQKCGAHSVVLSPASVTQAYLCSRPPWCHSSSKGL